MNMRLKRNAVMLIGFVLIISGCANSKGDVEPSGTSQTQIIGNKSANSSTVDAFTNPTDANDQQTKDPFRACGFSSFAQASNVVNQRIGSSNIPIRGVAGTFNTEYNVVLKGGLNFAGGVGQMTTTTNFAILAASPSQARDKATEEIKKITGSRIATMIDTNQWASIAGSTGSDARCGIFYAKSIREQTGDHFTTVEFDKPLPYLVSPLLSPARFNFEVKPQVYSGITVRVLQTTNTKTPRQPRVGTVSLAPAEPTAQFQGSGGRPVVINADYAFRIEFNFGDYETTMALGLYRVATYYVAGGRYVAVIIETGIPEAPVIRYLEGE